MKKIIISSAIFALALSAKNASAGGIPTIDTASIAQTILLVQGQAKQLTQLVMQVETAKKQLTEAQQTLKSISGERGMSGLADMSSIRQQIPADFLKASQSIRQLGESGASVDAKKIYQSIKQFGCEERTKDPALIRLCEAEAYSAPTTLALVTDSVKRAEQRAAQLQTLLKSIDTKDAKAAMDLQNRIQVETAMLANEKMLMEMALKNQETQKRLLDQEIKERGTKMLMNKASFSISEGVK